MTLYTVIETIKMLALKHPNINSAYEGNIYDIMNANPGQKYASVVLTQQQHTQDDIYEHYNFNIFYVDRLVGNMEDNRLQIQSTGKNMLSNIIKAFCEEFDAECDTINFHTFTERFADECAGVYATITIDMVKEINCDEKYWDESWTSPLISTVVRNQNKSVEFKENGTYTIEYDAEKYTGLGKVSVEVNVPDINGSYDDGYSDGYDVGKEESYEEGKQDGIKEGYTKGYNEGNLEGYNQGKTEGYQEGKTDGIEEGYTDGKEDGIEEGYSQGKSDGFNEGKAEGYTEGKTDGISQQKAKLEGITITENGTYTKEDGYNSVTVNVADTNGSYDEGYDDGYEKGKDDGIEEGTSNAGSIIAETAQVLNITENGTYGTDYTKFEDINKDITGYFDDGTPFYNYAKLTNHSFITDEVTIKTSRLEMWWKPDFNFVDVGTYSTVFSTDINSAFAISVRNENELEARIYVTNIRKTGSISDKWYHLILSKDEGFIVDGEKIGEIPSAGGNVYKGCINSNNSTTPNHANGYFGMVKLDDKIYIPTENGFINYATNKPLEVFNEGVYVYTGSQKIEGNLIRTVNVNVSPKINIQKYGIKFGNSTFKEVPEWADWEGITIMRSMFDACQNLESIPLIDTSNVTDWYQAFYNCSSLVEMPLLNTSNATNLSYLFTGCSRLVNIPNISTSKATNLSYMFRYCSSITTIPPIDSSNATNISYMLGNCKSLVSVPALNAGKVTFISQFFGSSDLTNLTDFGGLIDLKQSMNDNYGFVRVPNLSYQSCINILNGLYDFTGNGITPSSSQGKLKVHANFLTTVGDELSIGTNKGWTITA